MQHLDSEPTVLASSGDRKTDRTEVDAPPESFWLSKDAEFDWFDQNAFLERKESTKGKFISTTFNPNVNPSHSNSSSQRYSSSVKSKPPIIGLPKTQKTTYVDLKCRLSKPANVRLFPKQPYSVGKAPNTVPVTEPSSPKVSCIGRVRSKRCPSQRKLSTQASEQPVKSRHKAGLMCRIMSFFRSEGRRRGKTGRSASEKGKNPVERSGSRRNCVTVKPVNSEPETLGEPVGLGGMVRYASGRRSGSWRGLEDDI